MQVDTDLDNLYNKSKFIKSKMGKTTKYMEDRIMKKRILSLAMALVLLLSLLPAWTIGGRAAEESVVAQDADGGYRYAAMVEDLDALKERYGTTIPENRLTFTTIGKSQLGRDIPVVILGNQTAEQKLYVQGALQAGDALSAAFVVKQLEGYLAGWDTEYSGQKISAILDKAAIAFVPMANPDGVTLVLEGEEAALAVVTDETQRVAYSALIAEARNQAVTESPAYDGSLWQANINGVDLYFNFYNQSMLLRGSDGTDAAKLGSGSGSLGNYLLYHNQKGRRLLMPRSYGSYADTETVGDSVKGGCAQPESAAISAFLKEKGYTIALDYGQGFSKEGTDKAGNIRWDYQLNSYYPTEGGVLADQRIAALVDLLAAETGYGKQGAAGPKGFPAWFQIEHGGKFAANVNITDSLEDSYTACKDLSLYTLTYCMDTEQHPMGFERELDGMQEPADSIFAGRDAAAYTYLQMMEDLEKLKTKYASMITAGTLTVETIGYSELGRAIPAITIGNRMGDYKLYTQAGAQGTEGDGVLLLMKQVEYYLANMESGFDGNGTLKKQTLEEIFAVSAISFVPMANPDGVMLARAGLDSLDEAGLNLSAERKAEVKANVESLCTAGSVTTAQWDSNINGIDVYYNVYSDAMAKNLSGILNAARKGAAATSGTSGNKAWGSTGISTSETRAITKFIDRDRFNLLIDYHMKGVTSAFSNGNTAANPKDYRWRVSDLTKYHTIEDIDALQNNWHAMTKALAACTGLTNSGVGNTSGLSARALDGWFQANYEGAFGMVLDSNSDKSADFAARWTKRKDASLFLLCYAAEKEVVLPIDRSDVMGITYESVVDRSEQRYDYYDLKEDLAAMQTKYASLVEAGKVTFTTLGKSELGRDIPVVIIGNREGKNKLFVMGNEHAREDINARLVTAQIELYLETLLQKPDMTWEWDYANGGVQQAGLTWGKVFEENAIAFVPTANPDGLQLIYEGKDSLFHEDCTALTAAEKEALWQQIVALSVDKYANRKAEDIDEDHEPLVWYDENGNPYDYTIWKSNIRGIDVFYNFYDWNMANLGNDYLDANGNKLTTLSSYLSYWKARSKDPNVPHDYYAPSSETSYGTFGMMAAETRSIADFIQDEGFNMAITYHNRGPVLKWDYRLGTYYPADSGVDGAGWSKTIKTICQEIATESGYSVSTTGSTPAGFVAWFQISHVGGFSVNVETGYGTFNGVTDCSPLKVAQFEGIWEENKYGPMIALTYCAYNSQQVIPTADTFEKGSKDYWPEYTVSYSWAEGAPAEAAVPESNGTFTYADWVSGANLSDLYKVGDKQNGMLEDVAGLFTFQGWEFNGWTRGEPANMEYLGHWKFEAGKTACDEEPKLHTWSSAYTVDKEPTCTEDGSKSIHCVYCDATKDVTVIPAAHTWQEDYTVDKEPTCTETGSKSIHCEKCDATKDVTEIPMKEHAWQEDYTVDKEPTCTEEGSKSIHCKDCDATKDVTPIPATGHSYEQGVCTKCQEKDPDYKAPGTPQTGDEMPVVLLMTLATISALAVGAAFGIRKKYI